MNDTSHSGPPAAEHPLSRRIVDSGEVPADPADPRRWLAALVMVGAVLMDMIDITIVNVALPTIRDDFGASGTQLAWVVSAYLVAFAAVLITAGSLGDLVGRKRIFLLGVATFGAASLAAGLAPGPASLIGARVVQGAAAAAMVPQLLATFRVIFPPEERGKAFGVYGGILGMASAVGLVLGGVLTELDLFGWSWRTIFLINVPVSLVAVVAASRVVPETREPHPARPDYAGAVVLTGGLVAVVYPLLEGRRLGWPVWGWLVLAAGIVALAGLAVLESRRDDRIAPLLRPELLRIPAVSAGLVVQAAFSAGLQGFFLVFAIWIQVGMGFSPLGAGLTTVAFSVGSFALAPFAVGLAQRRGRLVLTAGALLLTLGVLGVGLGADQVGVGSDPWPVLPGLAVAGAGLSLLVIPLVNVVLAAVPARAAGGAGGQFSTAQQLGGAVGVAVVGSVFFGGGPDLTDAFTSTLPVVGALFVLAALLSLALPRTAVSEEEVLAP